MQNSDETKHEIINYLKIYINDNFFYILFSILWAYIRTWDVNELFKD